MAAEEIEETILKVSLVWFCYLIIYKIQSVFV